VLFRDLGTSELAGIYVASDDLRQYLLACRHEEVPDVLEAMPLGMGRNYGYPDDFHHGVNRILLSHRGAYELIDGQMIPFESKELHEEVVAPTLRLLAGRAGWETVENAYQDALREIGTNPGDAITDAGRALQATLELLGCKGNALGPLIDMAKKTGLLAPHDSALSEGISKMMHWVSADRSEKGDAHKGADAKAEDAWLAVHVTGALILRLAEGPRT
jgi:hypothetical protein